MGSFDGMSGIHMKTRKVPGARGLGLLCVGLLVLAGAMASCSSETSSASDAADGILFTDTDTVPGDVTKSDAETTTDTAADAAGEPAAEISPEATEVTVPDAEDTGLTDVPPGATCDQACGVGDVVGQVCAPNSHTLVAGAKVWVDTLDCDGNPLTIETVSSYDGSYTLKHVPCGTWQINIEKGSFTHWFQVQVLPGVVNDVSMAGVKMCLGASAARLCVITGDWDAIEETLTELGFNFEIFDLYSGGWDEGDYFGSPAHNLLQDLGEMQGSCDVLFIDCGAAHEELVISSPSIKKNIQDFVAGGGSLYASDYAFVYAECAWPDKIDFYNQQGCSGFSNAHQMPGNTKLEATILDPDLIAVMGSSTFEANFGLGPLVAVEGGGLALTHVQGFVPTFNAVQPFVLSYKPYAPQGGTVLYTNFHNDEQTNADMAIILNYMVFQL